MIDTSGTATPPSYLRSLEAEVEVLRGALDTKCYELGEALKRIAELEKGVNEALAAIRAHLEGKP